MSRPRATPSMLRVRSFVSSFRFNAYERQAIERKCKELNWNEQELIRYALFGSTAGLVSRGEACPYASEVANPLSMS